MGNEPVELAIEKIGRSHTQRILAALGEMSIVDVRQLIDEIETQAIDEIDDLPK